MCVDDSIPLQEEIKQVTGYQIPVEKARELLLTSSLERIKYHLANWHIHKKHQKSEGAGWFFTVIKNDIEPEKRKTDAIGNGKVLQRDNFEQREYSKEYLESFYADLTECKPDTASTSQEEKTYTYIE